MSPHRFFFGRLRWCAAVALGALLAACQSAPPAPERDPDQPPPAPITPATPPQGSVVTAPLPGQEAAPPPLAPQRITTVRAAQQRLADLGYDVGTVDGLSGRRTMTALRAFQRDHGLPATGLLDATTAETLGQTTAR